MESTYTRRFRESNSRMPVQTTVEASVRPAEGQQGLDLASAGYREKHASLAAWQDWVRTGSPPADNGA